MSATTQLAVLTFTDVVDSTDLKRRFGMNVYSRAIQRHNAIFEETGRLFRGMHIVKYTGDGYFTTFSTVADAVRFALLFQHRMRKEPWGELKITTRLGLHVGEVAVMEVSGKGDIIGLAADLAARLMSLAVGGQILLTRMAFDDARQFLSEHPPLEPGETPPPLRWLAHGPYLFKGSEDPIEVYEVGAEALAPLCAPPDSEKVKRQVHVAEEPTLGWRPAIGMPVPSRPNWLLERKLGEGGFGEVWLAEHQSTQQRHVFKFCFDAERLRSFKRELTIFRLIKGALGERDDIVRLHEVKFDEPPFFLESDFAVEGNLCQWAEKAGGIANIPLEKRIDIVARVAKALAAAHSIGVLHKDIKPANILMQADGDGEAHPQLVDFGIGAIRDHAVLAGQQITVSGFTMASMQNSGSSGTPVYMPPEALAGLTWTEQGDIYSLGIVLYQVVAGDLTRPLAGGWERDVPDELLREDIARCVDGDRAHRLESASELALRLEGLPARRKERAKTIASAQKLVRARRLALKLAALVMIVIAAAGIWGWKANARLVELEKEQQRQLAAGRLAQRASRSLESGNDPAGAALLFTEGLAMRRAAGGAYDDTVDRRRIGCALRAMPRLTAAHSLDRMDFFQIDPTGNCAIVTSRSEYRAPDPAAGLARSGEAQLCFFDGRGVVPLDVSLDREVDAKVSLIRAAFDAKGEYVAAAAEYVSRNNEAAGATGGILFVWRVEAGGMPRKPIFVQTFPEPLRDLAFNPATAAMLAIASRAPGRAGSRAGGQAFVYDWQAEQVLRELPHDFPVSRVAFSANGRRLATACGDPNAKAADTGGECQLIDVEKLDAAPIRIWHQEPVNWVSFNPKGDLVVTAAGMQNGFYGDAQVWNAETGAAEGAPLRHAGAAMVAEFSPDGERLLTASQRDGKARIWSINSPYPLHALEHDAHVFTAAWSPDGRYVATGSRDQMARVWDTTTGELAAPVLYHGGTVNNARFSPEGRYLLAGMQGTLRLWDLSSGHNLAAVTHRYGQARLVSVSPDGAWLAVVTEEESFQQTTEVHVVNALTGAELWKRPLKVAGMVHHVAFSADGAQLAIASERRATAAGSRGQLRLCNVNTAEGPLFPIEGAATFVAWSAAAAPRLLVLSKDAQGKVSRATVLDPDKNFQRHWTQPEFPIECAAISRDGTMIATGGGSAEPRKGAAFVLAVDSVTAADALSLHAKVEHDEAVRAVAFNPSSGLLATGAVDDEARVWDLRAGAKLVGRFRHTADLTSVGFYAGGARLLSTSFDGTAVAWDVQTGAKLGTCRHKAVVRHAAANADGSCLVTGSDDQTARVWSANSFEPIAILSHPAAVQTVGFCAKEQRVFGAGILVAWAGADRPGNRPDVLNLSLGRAEFRSWDFTPDRRDVAELRLDCQRLAARAIPAGEHSTLLTQLDAAGRKALLPAIPSEPVHTRAEMARYYREQIAECQAAGLWKAAAWHAQRLAPAREGDYVLRARAFFHAGEWAQLTECCKGALTFRNGSDDTPELRRILAFAVSEGMEAAPGEAAWTRFAEVWNEALEREPDDTFLLLKKAEFYIRARRFDLAQEALQKAIANESENEGGARLSAWQRLAGVYLMDPARRADYEKLCADLISRFENVTGYGAIVAWPRLLQPLGAADTALAAKLVALAQAAVSEERANPYRLNTLGAALVRAGKFADAVPVLDDARRIFHRMLGHASPQSSIAAEKFFDTEECRLLKPEQGRPVDWIFLALAHHGLGNDPLARKWLQFAKASLQSESGGNASAVSNRRIWNDLEMQVLLKEVEAAIAAN